MTGRRERIHQLCSNFVAARTDARPNRRDDVSRLRSEFMLERFERRDRRARGCAAPARVHGSHDTAMTIGHEQRHAIGDANRHRHIATARDEGISLRRNRRRRVAIAHDNDCSPVDLLGHRDGTGTDRRGQHRVVSGDARESCLVVNRCGAIAPSGVQRSAAPHDSVVHSNASGMVGRLM